MNSNDLFIEVSLNLSLENQITKKHKLTIYSIIIVNIS